MALKAGSLKDPMWTYEVDRTPFAGDPRHALARVLDRYATRGWQVVAATELEFYLVDDSHENPFIFSFDFILFQSHIHITF